MNRTERTQALIDYYKSLPSEWQMLKGVLCMGHPFGSHRGGTADRNTEVTIQNLFDPRMIAKRLDDITNEQIRKTQAEHDRLLSENRTFERVKP